MGHALYLAHGGQAPQPGEYCTVHLGTVEGGRAVYLHCGHSFCLRPCFWNLCRHGFTKCPTCWTPLVVMSPDFRYFDALLSALVPRRSARLEGMAHVSKLRQFRQFHDGSLRPEAWTAEVGLYTDALSHSDFLTQVRRACVSCPFAQYGFRPRSRRRTPGRPASPRLCPPFGASLRAWRRVTSANRAPLCRAPQRLVSG
mmetsp:Transcript_110768/g.345218  ORF Transcript_110768/g.345218 Transcript_110768/m.345218 type:complete len:199 (+) Transcript_110768:147-743(+)